MGNHARRVQGALGDHVQRLHHIGGIAAGGAHDVGSVVVYVVEVELGGQLGVGGAREEVQAAVTAQDVVALLDDRGHRGEHQHVVVALAAGEGHQLAHRVLAGGIQVYQLHAVLGGVLHGVDGGGPVQPGLVDVGDHQHAGPAVAVDGVVDGAQAHGARAGQDSHVAALYDAHIVDVLAGPGVVHGVIGAHNAAQGLGHRAVEEGLSAVLEQAVGLHHLGVDDGVGGVAAHVLEGVAGGGDGAVHGRLDGEFLAGLELVLPTAAHLLDDAAELMAHDDRVLVDIGGHPLVVGALHGRLIGGHADGIADDFDQNFVVLDGRQLEALQAQVVDSVQPYSGGFHSAQSSIYNVVVR